MLAEAAKNGDANISSQAVRHFPTLFRGTPNANLIKASRIWKKRARFKGDDGRVIVRGVTSSLTRVTANGLKRIYVKAATGRGLKRSPWVIALNEDLREEFDRLRKLGVTFNLKTLRALALHLIQFSERDGYCVTAVDPRSDMLISTKITPRWIQAFTDSFRIVSRADTGKLLCSPQKEAFIEKEVSFHLGVMARKFRAGEIDENDIENADETHFLINLDNGRTLGFQGEDSLKYADFVAGGEVMTMLVRITGVSDAGLAAPFMLFRNKDRNYPIRGVPDDINGVDYRTGPKVWMETKLMPQWLKEPKVIRVLPHGRKRILYLDNCSGQNETPEILEALRKINTEVKYFPPNAIHLIQPADTFIIQKIKKAWCTHWEHFKMSQVFEQPIEGLLRKTQEPREKLFLESGC